MKYTAFHEQRFRDSVDKAMKHVQTVLDTARQPRLAEEEDHTYDGKYALAEFLTNTSIACQMNALDRLGLDSEKITKVMDWVHPSSGRSSSVTLRFSAEDKCHLMKEQVVDINVGFTHEIEKTTSMQTKKSSASTVSSSGVSVNTKTETIRTKVIAKVTEYHWKVTVNYKILIFPGNDSQMGIELQRRSTERVIITTADTGIALPESTIHPPIDIKLTWFFQMLSPKEQTCQFRIHRDDASSCKTPCRNDDIDAATNLHIDVMEWTRAIQSFFVQRLERGIDGKHNPVNKKPTAVGGHIILEPGSTGIVTGLLKEPSLNGKRVLILEYNDELQRYKAEPLDDSNQPSSLSIQLDNVIPDVDAEATSQPASLATIDDDTIMCPIIPLMEKNSVLDMGDVAEFLTEQGKGIDEMIENLSKSYPPKRTMKLISINEATIVLICKHIETLATQYMDSIYYIEHMLYEQLTKAIGKEIGAKEFAQFVRFHNRRLFAPTYRPNTFSYAIRRPGFYPDGIITIEAKASSTNLSTTLSPEPIETYARRIPGKDSRSIYMPINAATSVEITGDRYVHGWMQQRFESNFDSEPEYNIACRSRQFCSFILIVGSMSGPDTFEPKDAIVIQNKDEILIPLLTTTLPSIKKFKKAIVSLSPEQQEFATSFRSMQLESSVFAVCVIQLKPQLEKLLGLPEYALTKEIQLTQDLLSLFIDYQIPSDLLSLTSVSTTSVMVLMDEKVASVRGYVKAVMDVIASTKEKQLKEEEMKLDMRGTKSNNLLETDKEKRVKEMANALSWLKSNNVTKENDALSVVLCGSMGSGIVSIGDVGQGDTAAIDWLRFSAPDEETEDGREPKPAAGPDLVDDDDADMDFLRNKPNDGFEVDPLVNDDYTPWSSAPDEQTKDGRGPTPSSTEFVKEQPSVASAANLDGSNSSTLASNLTKPQPLSTESEKERAARETHSDLPSSLIVCEDFTLIPKLLDARLEKIDTDGALRSTIVETLSNNWKRMRQENLLVPAASSTLSGEDIRKEKKAAFDLLDAISRSGTLAIDCSELHIMVAVSHCFENDIMGSVVQDNINPIEKIERSSVLLASCIHHGATVPKPQQLLVDATDVTRLSHSFPGLFANE